MADNEAISADGEESAARKVEVDPFQLTSSVNDSILIRDLPEGSVIKLRNGATAEVTGNPRDGGWLFIKILDFPEDPSRVGSDDMAFCIDVVGAQ